MLSIRSLSDRDIVRKVKGALLPLRCVVEVKDGAGAAPSVLRLCVLNPGTRAVRMPQITLGSVRDERELDKVLWNTRMELERQGFALN